MLSCRRWSKVVVERRSEFGLLDGEATHRVRRMLPFVELTPAHYARELAFQRALQIVTVLPHLRTA